jgi:hypothetical protein
MSCLIFWEESSGSTSFGDSKNFLTQQKSSGRVTTTIVCADDEQLCPDHIGKATDLVVEEV